MNDHDKKAEHNAQQIRNEIDSLSRGHWNLFQRRYKDFWVHAKEISNLFRTLKPLKKEDRKRLWEKFSSVCEEAKRKQIAEYENKEFKSKQHRNDIIREAENARPQPLFGLAPPDAEDLKTLGMQLKKASSKLSKYKDEMFGEHKQECFKRIQEIRQLHDLWWQEIKRKRSKRQEEFRQKVRFNLEKNYERHRKASAALRNLRNHADRLRSQISSAWNDDFRDRAYGWLSEIEDKIRNIENYLSKIEDWIREDEDKLR